VLLNLVFDVFLKSGILTLKSTNKTLLYLDVLIRHILYQVTSFF